MRAENSLPPKNDDIAKRIPYPPHENRQLTILSFTYRIE
jgi:hypothetical protein